MLTIHSYRLWCTHPIVHRLPVLSLLLNSVRSTCADPENIAVGHTGSMTSQESIVVSVRRDNQGMIIKSYAVVYQGRRLTKMLSVRREISP